MDIQAIKLELIQYLLNTDKESLLQKVKELVLKEERKVNNPDNRTPFTIEQLNAKLERAEEDYNAGRITTDEDLAKEIETW